MTKQKHKSRFKRNSENKYLAKSTIFILNLLAILNISSIFATKYLPME